MFSNESFKKVKNSACLYNIHFIISLNSSYSISLMTPYTAKLLEFYLFNWWRMVYAYKNFGYNFNISDKVAKLSWRL